ncbi:S8 family serine peptidase [Kribbella sp.]|uniref:S8 family serine peptidase n=1 Tax=Kribbella sp. TaxID=1871183 RepID=UPI002D26782A|nr:S8 family serine peptidase [Kribbella sp.]HZX02650.1 S8 family serine peptidase [Kribbella sp.]
MVRPVQLLRWGLPAALVAGSLVALTGSSGSAAEPGPYRPGFARHSASVADPEPNAVLVKFKRKATASARKAAASKFGGTAEEASGDVVKLTGDLPARDLLKKVEADPAVELASLSYRRQVAAVPNDPYFASTQQAYLNTVRVPQAWDVSKSTGNQIVAVLDTGIDAGHPDLAGHLVAGYNAVSTTRPNPVDDNGHGTMVAGIIAAAANNGAGVAGVGWSSKVMPVKVAGSNGLANDLDLVEGIDWAVAHGATVLNISIANPGDNTVLHDAIKRAVAKGVVVVAASGNDGSNVAQYPAAYPEVIAVAATTASGVLTDFSSYGDWVDIAAPGWDIVTTGARNLSQSPYWLCSGTSCAAPIVAGVAALVKNKWPGLTPAQLAARLKAYSRDAGPRGTDPYFGAGMLDAYAALGGRWAADFPMSSIDLNDSPERAIPLSSSISTTISTEGETDWYEVVSSAARNLSVSLTGPEFNGDKYPLNFGLRIDLYDGNLKSLASAVTPYPGNDPATGRPKWGPLTAATKVSVPAGSTFIAVRNANGSRDTRPYTLNVEDTDTGATSPAVDYPVRDVSPPDLSSGQGLDTRPSVTFARDVVAGSVNATTVRLLHGKTGATIGATVAYDAQNKLAVLTPSAPLLDNTPYRISVSGVQEAGGTDLEPFTSVFSTLDAAPPKPAFDASGAYLAANLTWKVPSLPDLDQILVRRNPGSHVPTPTTGTLVYAGTGAGVRNTGLAQGVTYTYGAWVKDRGGKLSPVAVSQLLGMKTTISTTASSLNYGGTITLRGSTIRIDNKAYAGLPVNLYVRPKNSSAFKLLAALRTTSTGTVSYAYKPAVSSVFMMTFPGNGDLMGTRSADVTVQVAPTISATLAPASIRLGQAAKFSGYVAPAHYGKPVYLQQYVSRAWKSIASVKLTTSGAYAFGVKPAARGQAVYRVWFPADADHAQAFTANKILAVS